MKPNKSLNLLNIKTQRMSFVKLQYKVKRNKNGEYMKVKSSLSRDKEWLKKHTPVELKNLV